MTFGFFASVGFDGAQRRARIAAGPLNETARETLRVVEQNFEKMVGSNLLVVFAEGQRLGRLNEALGAVRVSFEIHVASSSTFLPPHEARKECHAI